MIERRWKTWVYFYIPLTVFVIGTLFPFYWMLITAIRPDSELYRSWRDCKPSALISRRQPRSTARTAGTASGT